MGKPAIASLLHHSDRVDYHVSAHWAPILNKRTWSTYGGPWRWHEGEANDGRDACPRTLDLMRRAINPDVSPELTDQNMTEMIEAVNKVLSGAL